MSRRVFSLAALVVLLSLGVPAVAGAAVPANVKRVIADFRNDGRIEPCRHTANDYRDTLEEIETDTEQYAPDFPIAVQAAGEARKDSECDKKAADEDEPEQEPEQEESSTGPPTTSPPPAATPVPTPAPAAPALPGSSPPVDEATPAPSATAVPEVTPAPTAAPGAGAGITPGVPPATTNKPDVVLTRTSDNRGARVPLAILAGALAAALLAGLLALLMRRFGWGAERLAGVRHAWGEASYRTGGTWQSFTDWLRLGR